MLDPHIDPFLDVSVSDNLIEDHADTRLGYVVDYPSFAVVDLVSVEVCGLVWCVLVREYSGGSYGMPLFDG